MRPTIDARDVGRRAFSATTTSMGPPSSPCSDAGMPDSSAATMSSAVLAVITPDTPLLHRLGQRLTHHLALAVEQHLAQFSRPCTNSQNSSSRGCAPWSSPSSSRRPGTNGEQTLLPPFRLYGATARASRNGNAGAGRGSRAWQSDAKVKDAAHAQAWGLGPHTSAHPLAQALTDGQAQAGTVVLTGGRQVNLLERVKVVLM